MVKFDSQDVDDKDWCADARKKVIDGSDGLWFRLGPKPSEDNCKSLLLSIHMNPCTSIMAIIFLFGLVIFCSAYGPDDICWTTFTNDDGKTALEKTSCYVPGKVFKIWQDWVTENFTWLYIGTQDAWIVFAAVVALSKYGKLKLGGDDEAPEFGDFSFFSMVFTCGVATGLFFYATSEPIYHYKPWQGPTRWAYAGVIRNTETHKTDQVVMELSNRRAQEALNMTWYHWGLHGWVCYSIMGVLLAFLHFRKGLPMTIKTCFYPLMGTRCYGFIGDVLDAISMCATTMGVCTSLGLGVMQLDFGIEALNGGKHWLGEPYYNKYNFDTWKDKLPDLYKIWDSFPKNVKGNWDDPTVLVDGNPNPTATWLADTTAKMDQQTFLIWIITMGATTSVMCGLKYGIRTLALTCFGLGCFLMYYIWMMDDTWFITNLFVQSTGHYIQYLPQLGFYTSAFEQMESGNADGYGENKSYQNWWTIFYWGWWIAWAPFVGVFLARIARGRTIRQFILWTILLPTIYNVLFMTIFGGAALKMQLAAEENGIGVPSCKTASGGWATWEESGGEFYHVPSYKKNICRSVGSDPYTGEPEYFCSTITNLDCSMRKDGTPVTLFDVLQQYADMGTFLVVIALIALVLYFIASSDSGSMVDDMISANGLPEPPLPQRFFWAMTEGAAATVLLRTGIYTGKADGGLKALQAISIVVGLPYTFFICFMCLALWRGLQYEFKDRSWTGNAFSSELCDCGVTLYKALPGPTKIFNFSCGGMDPMKLLKTVLYVVCPAPGLWKGTKGLSDRRKNGAIVPAALTGAATFCFYLWLILCIIDYVPVNTEPIKMGAVVGNATDPSGSTISYFSTRYGYFRGWTNTIEANAAIVKVSEVVCNSDSDCVSDGGSICGADGYCQVNKMASETGVGAGARMGRNMRVEALAYFFYFVFVTLLAMIRNDCRNLYKIPGSLLEDFLSAAFVYPTVVYQIQNQVDEEPKEAAIESKGAPGTEQQAYMEAKQAYTEAKAAADSAKEAAEKVAATIGKPDAGDI